MKTNSDFFLGEKLHTSLADIFTMEKPYSWHKCFICEPIFRIFVALLNTFGVQNCDMVIFFSMPFRKCDFEKCSFWKMVNRQ